MKRYIVKLAKEERADLSKLIAQGKASARKLTHARILLKADRSEDGPGWTDQAGSRGLGNRDGDGRAGAATPGGRGSDRCAQSTPTAHASPAQIGWRAGSASDCAGVQPARGGTGTLELTEAFRQAGAIAGRGEHFAGNGATGVRAQRDCCPGSNRAVVYSTEEQRGVCVKDWRMSSRCTHDLVMNGVRRSVWMKRASSW
jgi:hypothetical protein